MITEAEPDWIAEAIVYEPQVPVTKSNPEWMTETVVDELEVMTEENEQEPALETTIDTKGRKGRPRVRTPEERASYKNFASKRANMRKRIIKKILVQGFSLEEAHDWIKDVQLVPTHLTQIIEHINKLNKLVFNET